MGRAHHCGLTLLFILIMMCVILMSSQMIEPNSGGMASGGNTARRAAEASASSHDPHPVLQSQNHPLPFPRARERLVPNPKARVKEQIHEGCRLKHLPVRSEEAYWGWVVRLLVFHREKAEMLKPEKLKAKSRNEGWINPRDMSGEQLGEFLTHLAAV